MRRSLWGFLALLASVQPIFAKEAEWRRVAPENLVLIEVQYGTIALELAPQFAPAHAARFRALIREGFYDGLSFYRVIDGFVAQGGIGEGDDKKLQAWPALKAEMERPSAGLSFTLVQSADLFAGETGFIDGFPAARDALDGTSWLVHCPGLLAMARDDAPDTGATEFYIVIGQAPRRLDRIMSSFGRVIDGLEHVQKLNRGDPEVDSGVIAEEAARDKIIRMRIAADMPEAERPPYEVMRTDTEAFEKRLDERRYPASPFFFRKPPPILDVCTVSVPVRLAPPRIKPRRATRR
ncbi:MAG: peptidylprolyl isomerase [Alphaproteobacteria bacterium]|nr:peptidylprolyl isomerase [Alphaproteobacteria bacterium]